MKLGNEATRLSRPKGDRTYRFDVESRDHGVHTMSIMATLNTVVRESLREEAFRNMAAGDNDDCFPVYQPRVQTMSLEVLVTQL